MNTTIKYVGPFRNVTAEGISFERSVAVSVPTEIANRFLSVNTENKPLFEAVSAMSEAQSN